MALVPIINQTWDTTSYVNPTRMNTIENNIAIVATAEGTKYSNGVSVKDKIDDLYDKNAYHKGDSITIGGGNIMYAGRTGWAGKEFYFGIPLDKPIGSDVSSATLNFLSGGSVYLVSYNQAIDITNSNYTPSVFQTSSGKIAFSIKLVFTSAPLSITDGVVNLMLNKGVTITFA